MRMCRKCCELHEESKHPGHDGMCYWCATINTREPDRSQLIFRVVSYYRKTLSRGGNTLLMSGYMTEYDARNLLRKLAATDLGEDPHIERRIQGADWHRSAEYDKMISSQVDVPPKPQAGDTHEDLGLQTVL